MSPDEQPMALLAGGAMSAAEKYAESRGWKPRLLLTKADIKSGPRSFRRTMRDAKIESLAVYTSDWELQQNPQLYELALALAPVKKRVLADARAGDLTEVKAGRLARRVASIPADVVIGAGGAASEVVRFLSRNGSASGNGGGPRLSPGERRAVLAVWVNVSDDRVGGAVTHISGILDGFRRLGLRVGLVTAGPPPPQLADVVDDLEMISSLPPGGRINSEIECLSLNRAVRDAGTRLAARLGPAFVYQRHRPFFVAGLDIAEAIDAPLVLEWNNSEIWTRENWPRRSDRVVRPLLVAMERRVVTGAALVAAVSEHSATMATEVGADPANVAVVPNGVDVETVAASVEKAERSGGESDGCRIGWVGSFGFWHGAEVLIEAMAHLPEEYRLVMVGEGENRPSCMEMAERLGVAGRITWTGALPHPAAVETLGACDVLASPHIQLADMPFFGSPTKLFEYMAIGRPIVASRLEQLGEVLDDGRTARLVAPGSPEELAAGIREVWSSPDRGAALGAAAREEAERLHTWEGRASAICERLGMAVERVAS